jgi:hypothetical protein
MSNLKIIGICVIAMGLILGLIERLKSPPLLALAESPKYMDWVPWAGWIITAVGTIILALA